VISLRKMCQLILTISELQTLDESDRGIDVEELLVQLKHVLDILQSDEKGGNHYEKDNI
jgi:Fe-S cluster assembly ATPase SufC